jgi:hypothetical protein
MDRETLRFWTALILACAVFAVIPWKDVHPATLTGYPELYDSQAAALRP